ncbi:methyltransferase domain-containing protein [Pseudoalteromonas sp. MMG010]|uniref:methyltransferase domain-containing protein n=1 Tax=Pseudoalteromonas sp. MMG010 TaxID=2822685 RepID=UPI001B3A580C|nr:methyltransferase domain-containing protein [Pseudoalteromonas sp. MMG010]MBQ4832400.1 methyltransferase domain-containing protein [Pseudoalteromonas sp. MMG010]
MKTAILKVNHLKTLKQNVNISSTIATGIKFSNAANHYENSACVQKQAASDLFNIISHDNGINDTVCLDLGAGPLVNTEQLQARFKNVIAMDLSLAMLNRDAINNHKICSHKICADMDKLPFLPESFDTIFSNFAVQWSSNFRQLVENLYTILKPDGHVYVSVLVSGSLTEIQQAFRVIDNDHHINSFNDDDSVIKDVLNAGFNITRCNKKIYIDKYDTPFQALNSIKAIGASNVNHQHCRKGLLTKSALKKVCDAYPISNNQACVSYHVVLLSLKKER